MLRTNARAVPTRNRLLSSCALAAIATLAVNAQPARAQIAGDGPTVVGGSATFSPDNSQVTNIAPRTIINWANVPEVALPDGAEQSFDGAADYVVLNRLLPQTDVTNPAQLNGTVTSTIGGEVRGGSVWFYTPNGIIVGVGGTFNVGSLLLSTSDVGNEDFLDNDPNFSFQPSAPGASIDIQRNVDGGANINALGSNAYVALISPRIKQSGDVRVNGSANYIAAEAVDIVINRSLFDISVTAGTTATGDRPEDAALVHDGNTVLENNEVGYGASADARYATLVAIPKNDAITMLVSGNIGYQPADGAVVVDNKIILSAGYNVRSDGLIGSEPISDDVAGTANIGIANGLGEAAGTESSFGPNVVGQATGLVRADSTFIAEEVEDLNATDLEFGGSVDLTGAAGASLIAGADSIVTVGRDLFLDASGSATGVLGAASLIANTGSNIIVNGDVSLEARTDGSLTGTERRTAQIIADGGRIDVPGNDGNGQIFADAQTFGADQDDGGGDATGGIVRIEAKNGGSIFADGGAFFSAEGFGGSGLFAGGNGTGGTIDILATGGTIELDSIRAVADGFGGGEDGYGAGVSGDGTGGTITLAVSNDEAGEAQGAIDVVGLIELYARGFGGGVNTCSECFSPIIGAEALFTPVNTGTGGAGTGGTINMLVEAGSLDASDLRADVQGFGGDGSFEDGEDGTDGSPGVGGEATFTVNGGTVDLFSLDILAAGFGGEGGNGSSGFGDPIGNGGRGGDGAGGAVTLAFNGGTSDIRRVDADSGGFGGEGGRGGSDFDEIPIAAGGNGGRGGDGHGGEVSLSLGAGATLDSASIGLFANAEGGSGGDGGFGGTGGSGGDGGDAFGGILGATIAGGELTVCCGEGGFDFEAEAEGGDGGDGADGAVVGATGGAAGTGGLADGGTATFRISSGSASTDDLELDVDANGGDGGFNGFGAGDETNPSTPAAGGAGGNALGGDALVEALGGTLDVETDEVGYGVATFDFNADAEGGEGNGFSAVGGNGQGGTATVRAAGGDIMVAGDLFLDVAGRGGGGTAAGAVGTGGIALVQAAGAGSLITVTGFAELLAIGGEQFGFSCCSDVAADGKGGTARIVATGGATLDFGGDVDLLAFGRGGDGDDGGADGFGGIASVLSSGAGSDIDVVGDLFLSAESFGGVTFDSEGGYGNGGGEGLASLEVASGGRIGAGSIILDVSGEAGQGFDCCSEEFGRFGSFALAAAAVGSGSGGDGIGGTATVTVNGVLATPSLTLDATGTGGDGIFGFPNGGNGTGGTATVNFTGGTNTLASVVIDASGTGGQGLDGSSFDSERLHGGHGGIGTGGTANLLANGGIATINQLSIDAFGQGGRGGDGAFGNSPEADGSGIGSGGAGGAGFGGTILVAATAGSLTLPGATFVESDTGFDATGRGGDGGNGGSAFSGGNGGAGGAGGDGRGGTAELRTTGGSLTVLTEVEGGAGNIIRFGPALDARGFGGEGGFGGNGAGAGSLGGNGGAGGSGTGGGAAGTTGTDRGAIISVAGGTLTTGGTSLLAGGQGGDAGSGGSDPQAVAAADGIGGAGTGGSALLRVQNAAGGAAGIADLGDTGIDATGTGGAFTFEGEDRRGDGVSGAITVASTPIAGSLTMERLVAIALGRNDAGHVGFSLTTEGTPIEIAGEALIQVQQNASLLGRGSGSVIIGGDLRLFAGGSILLAQEDAVPGVNLLVADNALLQAGQVQADGAILGETAGVAAVNDLDLEAPGNILLRFAGAGDDVVGTSSAGSIEIGTAVAAGEGADDEPAGDELSGSNIDLTAAGDVRLNEGTAVNDIALTSNTGSVLSDGTLRADRLLVSAALNIDINDVFVVQDLQLTAAGGFIAGGTFNSDGSIALQARDSITLLGGANAGTFFAATGGAFAGSTGGDVSVGAVDAGTFITLTANGGNLAATSLTAGSDITGTASGSVDVDAADAVGAIFFSAGTTATLGSLSSAGADAEGDGIQVEAGGGIALTSATATGGDIDLDATGSVTAGTLTAGRDVEIDSAEGDVTVDSITANLAEIPPEDAFSGASIIAGGDIVVGSATADNVAFAADGSIGVGSITADNVVLILPGTTARVDSVSTGGRLFVGNSSMLGGLDGDFDPAAFFALTPVATGGDVSLGAVEAGRIDAYAGGNLTVGSAASGGLILLSTNGGNLDATSLIAGTDIFGTATGTATVGTAEAGGSFSLNAGGDASADDVTAGADIAIVGANVSLGSGVAGRDIDLQAPGAIVVGSAQAGDDILAVAGTTFTGTNLVTTGLGPNGEGESGSNIFVQSAGLLTLANATAAGDLDLFSAGGSILSTGALNAGGDMAIEADGGVTLNDATTTNGEIEINAVDSIVADTLRAGTSIDLFSEAGDVTVALAVANLADMPSDDIEGFAAIAGGGNLALGSVTADNIGLGARGTVTAGTLDSDGLLLIFSGGDTNLGSVTSGGLFYVGSPTTLERLGGFDEFDPAEFAALPQLASGGDVTITGPVDAGSVSIVAGGALSFTSLASVGNANLVGANGVSGATIAAGGDVNLAASNGAVLVTTDLAADNVDASGRTVTLNATGPLAVRNANASAGNVALAAGGNLTIGNAGASGNVVATSGGVLGLNGTINGVQLILTSNDIAVGANAQVGTLARTTAIDITANNGTVTLGGAATGSGYRLGNSEFARFAARDISFRGGEGATVGIDALTVRGADASTPNVAGRLLIVGDGDVNLVGLLDFVDAGSGNSVGILAGEAFLATVPGGGISVTGAGGALTGSVDIEAPSIIVASQDAVNDLAAAGSIEARDERLGQNDGPDDRGGYIRAGGITLTASERIWVQNSGLNSDSPDDRGGLTAGSGGITLVTANSETPVEIIINGRLEDGAGGFITGEALIPELNIIGLEGGTANFDVGSTVNGCLILGSNCVQTPQQLPSPNLPSVQDVLEDLLDEDGLTRSPSLSFGQLISVEGGPLLGIVDDPVTGTGNDDIWSPVNPPELVCDPDQPDCEIDQPVTGTGNEELQRTGEPTPPTDSGAGPDDGRVDAPVTGTGNEQLQDGGDVD